MTDGPKTPKRKRPIEREVPTLDVLHTPKRSRVTFASISRVAEYARDFFTFKSRKFEETYIVKKANKLLVSPLRNFLSPKQVQPPVQEPQREAGDHSKSPDMFRKQQYEDVFTSQYVPHHPAVAPTTKGRDRPEVTRQSQASSFFGRPSGLQDVTLSHTKKPIPTMQFKQSYAGALAGPGHAKRRQELSSYRKNMVSKSYRPVHDKLYYEKKMNQYQRGNTCLNVIKLDDKAKFAELIAKTGGGPGFARPVDQSYCRAFADSTNRSTLFGDRTKPRRVSPKNRPWSKPDLNTPPERKELFFKKPGLKVEDVDRSWMEPSFSRPTPVALRSAPVQDVEAVVDLTSDDEDVEIVEVRPEIAQSIEIPKPFKTPGKREASQSPKIATSSYKERVTSPYKELIETCKYTSDEWRNQYEYEFKEKTALRDREAHETKREAEICAERREELSNTKLDEMIKKKLSLGERVPPVFLNEEEEEEEAQLAVLTSEMEDEIDNALRPYPENETLSEGFRMTIKRLDMVTLAGLNWLNDEIINFYLSLVAERGQLDNYPSVHTFNTFFFPKLMSQGHNGLKRWTRKVDVFSFDFIIVPVHLGMHWCLAIVDFRNKQIRYYDSMGGNNNAGLAAIRKYLEDESMDKRKVAYPTTDWELINVKGIPQQMNGSDCGMFLCKYAEYIVRDADITFSQEDMPYFRRRMVWEIVNKKLL
ncbi:uncharacterized protein LOC135500714 [Lineus longissimus]|uniref:uncharacterized protein LOC135500714 n=1 Tax=Lineus longissimus TaxID=88925 RepID=UPI00315DEA58